MADARAKCDKALALVEGPVYRVRWGECVLRSGQLRLAAGDILGAAADWRCAAQFYERLGYRAGEMATFEAGCHAMLSSVGGMSGSGVSANDGRLEAEKAMSILRQLVAGGYHAPELRNESLLDPLRKRPDFQEMMSDVVFPIEPISQ